MGEAEHGFLAAFAAVATQDIEVWDELRFGAALSVARCIAQYAIAHGKSANGAGNIRCNVGKEPSLYTAMA